MKKVWLITYSENGTSHVAASREKAYALAKGYIENIWLEDEDYRKVALRDLEQEYNSSKEDMLVIGFLEAKVVPLYD